MNVVGIDPAPVKLTVTFDGFEFEVVPPAKLRAWVDRRLQQTPDTLIAWDAPLSFDPATSFYSRAVDRDLADRAKSEPSINTAHFANLSHWAITCHVLGFPFGVPPSGLQLVDAMPSSPSGPYLIEVHPAFALFRWWHQASQDPVPLYKRGGKKVRLAAAEDLLDRIGGQLRGLSVLRGALSDLRVPADDLLDAAIAYEVGCRFIERATETVGEVASGFIVLPS